jgi:hypothetical protein
MSKFRLACIQAIAGIACLLLTACGHMPISTMYHLRNFDAATVDPAVLRVAVRIPETLEPQPHGVKLTVAHWRAGAESQKREHRFVLAETTDPADLGPLAAEARPGMRIHAFRVDQADLPAIRAAQAEAAEARRSGGGKGHGTLSVSADACHRGGLDDGPTMMTTFMRTEARGAWLTLLEDVDLRGAIPKGKTFADTVPDCEALTRTRRGRS